MNLDLGKFKKVKENNTHATLMHPAGHQITIDKNKLSDKLKNKLKSLPSHAEPEHLASGGWAGVNPGGTPIDPPAQQPGPEEPPRAPWAGVAPGGSPLPASSPAPQNTSIPDPDDSASSPANYQIKQSAQQPTQQMPQYADKLRNTFEQEKQGLGQQAGAQEAEGAASAGVYHDMASQTQGLIEQNKTDTAKFLKEASDAADEAHKGEVIQPMHFWDSKSTPGKIASAFGLILGGFGGGLSGKGNPALDFLNQNIQRDVDAQQATQRNKENVFNNYLKLTGDAGEARARTMAFYNQLYKAKLGEVGSKFQSPEAQARLKMAQAELDRNSINAVAPYAFKESLMKQGQSGGLSEMDPAQIVPYAVPQEHQKEVLHEIGQAQNAQRSQAALLNSFDQAAKENTVLRTGIGIRTPASILSMRAGMLPIIHDAEGRVNEFEQKTTSDLEPKPGDTDAKIAAKRVALVNFLNQKKSAPTAKSFGIDLAHYKSTAGGATPAPNPNVPNGYVQR